jgi:hypothetical protein
MKLEHKVNIMYPLTPHHIVVHHPNRMDFSRHRLSDIDPLHQWCRETFGDSKDWTQRDRVFMFANRRMAAMFKLAFA